MKITTLGSGWSQKLYLLWIIQERIGLVVTDESFDERPVLNKAPEYKISKDISAEKSQAKSVESKQPYNVITAKVEATFKEQPRSTANMAKSDVQESQRSKKKTQKMVFKVPSQGHSAQRAAAVPFMNGVNGATQYPLHVSQVCQIYFLVYSRLKYQ